MPSAAEATQNSNDVAGTNGELRGSEGRVVAGTDGDGVTIFIDQIVCADAFLFCEVGLAAFLEMYAVKTNKRELIGSYIVAKFGNVGERFDLKCRRVGIAVAVYVLLEINIRRAVERTGRITQLLLISVDGNAKSFEADVNFLARRVVVVDVALINEERNAAGLILKYDLLEDVAGAIVAAYARLEPEAVGNRHRIFLRGISIARAQFFDGDRLCTAG